MVSLPYSIIANITENKVQVLPKVTITNYTTSTEVERPVLLSADLYALAKRTIDTWDDSEVTRANYGYVMFGFWAIVLFIGTISRVFGIFGALLQRKLVNLTGNSQQQAFPRLQLWAKYWLTTPALLSRRTTEPLGYCMVPPRLQSFTVGSFVLINVSLCCVSYDLFDGNLL